MLSFIVAQDPLEQTVNEFWLMIVEHNVTTLVMLAEIGDGQSKCHCYWSNGEFDCDYVHVKLFEEQMCQHYTKRVFNITHKKVNIHGMSLFAINLDYSYRPMRLTTWCSISSFHGKTA